MDFFLGGLSYFDMIYWSRWFIIIKNFANM